MSETSMIALPAGEQVPREGVEAGQREIDLPALAERIYELLKQEARLERERMGWPQPRRTG